MTKDTYEVASDLFYNRPDEEVIDAIANGMEAMAVIKSIRATLRIFTHTAAPGYMVSQAKKMLVEINEMPRYTPSGTETLSAAEKQESETK